MESVVLTGSSKANMSILLTLARKLGIGVKRLSTSEMEDFGLIKAMKDGRTGEYIEVSAYLKKIRSK